MKTRKTITLTIGALLGLAAQVPLHATVMNIPLPTAAYTSGTQVFDAGPQDTPVTSLSDGNRTVTFSGATVIPRAAVPQGWQTWSAPPFSEGATPRVDEFQTPLACSPCTVTLTLSAPVKTFGFEIESDPFANAHDFAFTFNNGNSTVATGDLSFSPGGVSDARLMAMTTSDEQFTSVTISGTTDFALARIRYSEDPISVPEPATNCLIGLALVFFVSRRLLHSKRT